MYKYNHTPETADLLFRLVCYGRATPATISRALDIDRRTAQRLTTPESLGEIIPKPSAHDIATWYALLDPFDHSWTGSDGLQHNEARSARAVREDLAFLVVETIGDELKKRMVAECPRAWPYQYFGTAHQFAPPMELQNALNEDFTVPDDIMRIYRHKPTPDFTTADGTPLF